MGWPNETLQTKAALKIYAVLYHRGMLISFRCLITSGEIIFVAAFRHA